MKGDLKYLEKTHINSDFQAYTTNPQGSIYNNPQSEILEYSKIVEIVSFLRKNIDTVKQ